MRACAICEAWFLMESTIRLCRCPRVFFSGGASAPPNTSDSRYVHALEAKKVPSPNTILSKILPESSGFFQMLKAWILNRFFGFSLGHVVGMPVFRGEYLLEPRRLTFTF